jgi:hypothetical protein
MNTHLAYNILEVRLGKLRALPRIRRGYRQMVEEGGED